MTCVSDRRAAVIAVAVALVSSACGGDAAAPEDTASPDASEVTSDTEVADAPDTVAPDTTTPDTMVPPDGVVTPGFELGWNEQGANDPASFNMLDDGDTLEIVLGPQGLWMVVLAFRTRGVFGGPLELLGTLTVDGVEQGRIGLTGRTTFPGPEGWSYYYNFFLVVNEPTVAGQDGIVFLRASDGVVTRELTHTVRLTGGP